jgi:hypothetical protein
MLGYKGLIIILLHCMATIQPVTAHTHKIALLYFMHKVCQEKRASCQGQNANILKLLKSQTSGHRGGQIKKSVCIHFKAAMQLEYIGR